MSNLLASGRTGRRLGSLAAAGAVVAAITIGGGTAAQASTFSRVTLSDQGGQWTANGSRFSPGRSDVQLWVMDAATWTTVEYRGGISTTSRSSGPNLTQLLSGGAFSASGTQHYVPPVGLFGGGMVNDHPLQCGHSYQAVAYNPVDSYVYSDVLIEPACPVIH